MNGHLVRPYPEMVDLLFKNMPGEGGSLLHAVVGITGETGELSLAIAKNDFENMTEELGDMTFYIQKVLNTFGWTWADFDDYLPAHHSMYIEACELLDMAKKTWVYGQQLNIAKFKLQFHRFMTTYNKSRTFHGWTIEFLQNANRKKLAVRYPQGVYSDADAQARADKIAETQPIASGTAT